MRIELHNDGIIIAPETDFEYNYLRTYANKDNKVF